ncbi:tlde1 domain-containing protein [Methylobacterium sp. 17Sr1-1]|uniref:tlde1 domain-containing protein n=1 Tax=Methylobacterium sp. 17Sr1-1 TaxID=2202826 RepID=UPI001FE01AA2|nr:tlde1 domain-containing protein [Methylobacterium sp. 17Sr1-1]
MDLVAYSSGRLAPGSLRRRRRNRRLLGIAAVLGGIGAAAGLMPREAARPPVAGLVADPVAPLREARISPAELGWMLAPVPTLGGDAAGFTREGPAESHPLAAAATPVPAPQRLAEAAPAALVERDLSPLAALRPDAEPREAAPSAAVQPATTPLVAVPLPVPRPPELRPSEARPAPTVLATRVPRRSTQAMASTQSVFKAALPEEPSLFDRIFGGGGASAPTQTLAYAAPGGLDPSPRPRLSASPGIAVYDISARTVTLPSGESLEAHSGLGPHMDDPRNVHLKMRGATPPGTYDLTEREALFHGVRAIRLNPVGGSGAIHNRVGLLAHTYMLGPSGASNGCVSFRNYDRFLQAFLRGEVRRLVVVPGSGASDLPRIGRGGPSDRATRG